jgi:Protein of unknown function (DUF2868)
VSKPPRTSDRYFDDSTARRVLMVQAFEMAGAEPSGKAAALNAVWTAEDSAWATRVARESLSGSGTATAPATPAAALAERTRHALHRLQQRDKQVARTLAVRAWRGPWLLVAVLVGLLCGVAVDAFSSGQRVNLLAPPVWGVVLWNLLVYLALLVGIFVGNDSKGTARSEVASAARGFRGWWARRGLPKAGRADNQQSSPLARYAALWAPHGTALGLARAALLMHAAAAALALGLIGGLYARGLVLEFRAGWESTFLSADTVATVLRVALAPATALTGIHVPDAAGIEALRMAPGASAGSAAQTGGPAAPWIHLYAALLALVVVLPRMLLAVWAAARAWRLQQHVALPLQQPYFVHLLQALGTSASTQTQVLQVLPHGAAPSPQATLALQAWLVAAHGAGTRLQVAAATAYGQEDEAARISPPAGTTARVLLLDLNTTPEADTHGRWLQALHTAAPTLPLLLLADEAGFVARFAHLPARLAERRAAWQAMAANHDAGFVAVNLQAPDTAGAAALLNQALNRAPE